MNEYLMPAAAIAVELLKLWQAGNPDKRPNDGDLAALFEQALLSVMAGVRRAKHEMDIAGTSMP